jgi:hypothetical protein
MEEKRPDFVVGLFGDERTGKTSLIERLNPVCPFCSFLNAFKELDQKEGVEEQEKKLKSKVKNSTVVNFRKLQIMKQSGNYQTTPLRFL